MILNQKNMNGRVANANIIELQGGKIQKSPIFRGIVCNLASLFLNQMGRKVKPSFYNSKR